MAEQLELAGFAVEAEQTAGQTCIEDQIAGTILVDSRHSVCETDSGGSA